MSAPLASLVEAVASLIDAFERTALPYALGGAIAYSAWAEPRATRDVDLNVWVSLDRLEDVFATLEGAGVTLDRTTATHEARERGMFIGRHGEYRVDVFVPSVPFYAEALQRRVRTQLAHRDTWVLSPEVLVVFKMLFHRPKDLVDIGRVLQIQRDRFDTAFVRRWIVEMLGADDERVGSWDRTVAARH